MRTVSLRYLLPLAALFVAACGGGEGSVRSPDLPPERLFSGPNISCAPAGPVAVGETKQCAATGCVYQRVDAEGNVIRDTLRACPTPVWSVNNDTGTIDENGTFTAVKPGTVTVTGTIPGGSGETTVTVSEACANSLDSFTIAPLGASTVAGQPVTYSASLRLSDGSNANVTAGTTWASSDNRVTFSGNVASSPASIDEDFTTTITGSYNGSLLCAGVTGPATRTTTLQVTQATVITTGGLCIGVIPPASRFNLDGCRPDSGACVLPNAPIELMLTNPPQTRGLLVRARYNNGLECDVTDDATIASADTAVATLTGEDSNIVNGVGAGSTTINVAFGGQNASRPVTVTAGQVLGKNSLAVFSKNPLGDTEEITFAEANSKKFACIGANNLVIDGLGGRTPRGSLKAFALAATCAADMIDDDGNCTATPPVDPENPPAEPVEPSVAAFNDIARTHAENGVTNLPPKSSAPDADLLDDGIVWNSIAGYWNGPEQGCAPEASDPSGNVGDLYIDPRELVLGDDGAPTEPNPELGITQGAYQPNGLIYSDAAVRIGFNCVTATYTNPADPTQTITDGMTVLVLPATNDILLSGSNDGDQLCSTLAPLFGTGPLLGLVEVTPVLSAVTSGLTPLLQTLDAIPIDSTVTMLQGGLSAITAPLIDLLEQPVLDPLESALCPVTSAVNILLGILTGTTPEQACEETPQNPAP